MALVFNEFLIEVAKGKVAGHKLENFVGHNESLGATVEDLWPYGGVYTDTTTAAIHYISSDDNADASIIKVWYLDENWEEQIINVTLVGQTKTQIGTGELMMRVLKAETFDSTPFAGNVYIYENDTLTLGVPNTATKVRAKLEAQYQVSMQAKWAIPASKSGIIVAREVTSAAAKEVETEAKIRLFGKTYVTRGHPHLYNSAVSLLKVFPLLPEKTDIKFSGNAASAAACSVEIGLLLVDNSLIDFTVNQFSLGY